LVGQSNSQRDGGQRKKEQTKFKLKNMKDR
jgi:hypothetical protein